MKKKQIAKLRKKISEKGYYEKRWDTYSRKCEKWNDFWRWKCRPFFVGDERADRNQYEYNKYGLREMRKCRWYEKKVLKTN